jgi:CTD small phosphatase-like protein 2
MKFVRQLPSVDYSVLRQKLVTLAKRPGYLNRKTLIFDLDETLVHCCDDIETSNPDVILPVTFPTGEVVSAGINIRPYAIECLKEANRHFEVIIFTASHKCYADVVLNYLDPDGSLIHHRLYRESCIPIEGVNMKDLRILQNRKL